MPLLRERALIIFEEDVRDGEVLRKLKARIVTQMLPPHRYDCTLTVEGSLVFDGRDLLDGNRFRLDIPLDSVASLHLGYNDVFAGKDSKGKKYQLNPVRITYRDGSGSMRTAYIFPECKGLFRTGSSEEVYKILASIIKR